MGSSGYWKWDVAMMKILVDETHNPRGRLFSNFSELRRLLELNGHEIAIYDDFPIKHNAIKDADVLILPCCDGSKLYGHEIKALLRYIEEGHGIFVISHAGGDGGLGTNMNSLTATHFDIELQSDQVFDEVHCEQEMPSLILIREFVEHPIIQGLEQICYVAGCSLKAGRKAKPVVVSDADADPENVALIASWEGGKGKMGRVVVAGSYRMFSNYGLGINKYQNAQLVLNICEWLANSTKSPRDTAKRVESTPTPSALEVSKESRAPVLERISLKTEQVSPKSPLVSPYSGNETKLKKPRQMEEITPVTIERDHEPEVSSAIVIKLPILENLLTEVQLFRVEHQKSLEEIKELLIVLKDLLQRRNG